MVAIVVDTPLHFDDLVRCVSGNYRVAPVIAGLVIVNTNSSIVSTWPTSANLCCFQVGPSGDWLEDGAFGASINASLNGISLGHHITFTDSTSEIIPRIQAEYDLKEWSSIRDH